MNKNLIREEFINSSQDEERLQLVLEQILKAKNNIEYNIYDLGMGLYNAKQLVEHGKWDKWLADNVDFSIRTAQRYIKCYKEMNELKYISDNTENLSDSKLIVLCDVKKEDREDFIQQTHVINGEEKNIGKMSVRELQNVIKEYKKAKKKTQQEKSDNIVVNQAEEALNKVSSIDVTVGNQISTINIGYFELEQVIKDTWTLNRELKIRTGFKEEFQDTLVARFKAEEITHQQFINIISKEKLRLPIFFDKELEDEYLENNDMYSNYEHYGTNSKTYYSIFDNALTWEAINEFNDSDDEGRIDYLKSNHIEDGFYQLAVGSDDWGDDTYICIYKDYILLGTYKYYDDAKDLIKILAKHDELNSTKLMQLYKQLEQQYQKYLERYNVRWKMKQEQQKKYEEELKTWDTLYQPYTMGKYSFEDIWDDIGGIKNFNLWSEMTRFVSEQRKAQQERYSKFDFNGMFNSKTTIKEEEKQNYKKLYRILAKECHPDKTKDDGTLMQLANKLKEDWGV